MIDQKHLENVESFKYLGSMLTDGGRCTVKLNVGLSWLKLHLTRGRLFTGTLGLNLRKKLVKCYIWSIALCGGETGTVRAVDKKQLESFEMWCWRGMEKISWTDHVRNEEVLLQVNEQRNILHAIRKRKANWIGHILSRNCLLNKLLRER